LELIFEHSINSLDELIIQAEKITKIIKENNVVILNGNLGSGKTTLVKMICENYGIFNANSPSFSIVNEYEGKCKIFHFDFYRIKKIEELYDIGFEDYLNYENAIIFIEWGNLVPEILPKNHFEIQLESISDTNRILKFYKNS
jgi:tRNA threonylcarbamoyladenosine biosynthesis protein TsaE